jgi:hypothetical protein
MMLLGIDWFVVEDSSRKAKLGHAQNRLPVRATSDHVTLSLPVKRPY